MAILFYLLPIEVIGNMRGPMYLRWQDGPNAPGLVVTHWSMRDYGSINMGVVAVDGDSTQHTTLAAQANVYQFPENLDAVMTSGQRGVLSAYLETHDVPGDWIANGDTFRVALRTVTGMFLYMQRLTGMTGNVSPLDWGYTLNTQWRNISAAHRTAIIDAAMSLGYAVDFIANNTQVRRILKVFADAWGTQPIYFRFVTL